ncbi:MAG TPA: thioredoxin domain-containing protein, partial [Polyangiaceae bacterium]
PGFLDDHSYVAAAALALYEATGDEHRLATARVIADRIVEHFGNGAGALFFTAKSSEKILVRLEDPFDQAIPSGGAIAVSVFLHLGGLVDESYTALGERYLQRVAEHAIENPFGFGQTLAELDHLVRGSTDVVIVGRGGDAAASALRRAAFRAYLPNRNVVWVDTDRPESIAAAPILAADKPAAKSAVAYVCRNRTCSAPIADADELRRHLDAR